MDKPIIIQSSSSSPYFNLACEEYLLHQRDEDVIFLYTNEASVVIGKHQNAFDECNLGFCEANGIHIARRLSGGGTVFHGPGNLNFCFIKNGGDADKLIDFKKHLEPINVFLNGIGIPSVYSGRNDLLVDGFKISGNAEHVYSKKKRVIHHGTLLFNADLKALSAAIKPKTNVKFETHAVKSVRSKVRNIESFQKVKTDYKAFQSDLFAFLSNQVEAEEYEFSIAETQEIEQLVEAKYKTWRWNYGYSPNFTVQLELEYAQSLEVRVEKGMVVYANLISEGSSQPVPEINGKSYTVETLNETGLMDAKLYF